jgi:hypothetical protein
MLNEKIKIFLGYELKVLGRKNETPVIKVLKDESNNKILNIKNCLYILLDDETKAVAVRKLKFPNSSNACRNPIYAPGTPIAECLFTTGSTTPPFRAVRLGNASKTVVVDPHS